MVENVRTEKKKYGDAYSIRKNHFFYDFLTNAFFNFAKHSFNDILLVLIS